MGSNYKEFTLKKILFIGPEVTDFLNPLAEKLSDLGYSVDLLENRKIPRKNSDRIKPYNEVIDFQKLVSQKLSFSKVIKYFFKYEFYKKLGVNVFFDLLDGKSKFFKNIRIVINDLHLKQVFSPLLNKYDVISLQSISPDLLLFVDYIKREKKIILSYWGSDLFQIWGFKTKSSDTIKDHYKSLMAVKKTAKITVISYEMERALIAKFGSGIQHKIVRTFFSTNDPQFHLMDKLKNSDLIEFGQKYKIPENKIKITIGYCGDPICNHLLVIDELEHLGIKSKDRVHLLVPMTYGNFSDDYKKEVINKLNQIKISYTLFDKYLAIEEVVKLRLISDIMVQMSKSDALSSSVCEAIYAENVLISAIWLPYSPFRLSDIYFFETDFNNFAQTADYIINNYELVKERVFDNAEKIRELTALDKTLENWKVVIES